ncbi:ImmA/IrrE family metallo-endopeptidase [Anaerofustis stercorihominis]|uniref:ImmA/IrrE family metallo-endopeptidase n=1 Tax=Anaerofustis stercorihominis TaxID=214853 RepID=A0A3E3E249_9FIRM|nr:ImmA/IrrE family metallo-endopeptidase [Anaerofustis stercorihominis]RGD75641.1 ImmA/IrrE family metallo-endopeptidase [Anaerofustis stercorihominis]
MTKEEYKNIRDLAWYILRETKVKKLPVNIVEVCAKLDVKVRSYDNDHNFAKNYKNGFSIILKNGDKVIFYNKAIKNKYRNRFTIAHELGHIMLGHNINNSDKEYKIMETEANMFAIRILSPLCVLHEIKLDSAKELAEICRLSKQASNIRFKNFEKAEMENKFYMDPKEIKLVMQFKNFIKKYKKQRNKYNK